MSYPDYRLPLQGVRVIDMTVVWAGPFSTVLLSDMGAEIIRVESLEHPDYNTRGPAIVRSAAQGGPGGYPDDIPGERPWNRCAAFTSTGRNKKSVTMDLTRPEGREAFFRLAKASDIFIENNSAGVVERLGISWEVLSKVNPRLVMISMSGFGRSGPYRDYRAFGANMEAIVGHTLLRGYPDRDPTDTTPVFFADAAGGSVGAFAVLAALRYRNRTGKGQYIDMAQAENVGHFLSAAMMDYAMNARVQGTLGNRHPAWAPQGVYRCAGQDNWLALTVRTDAEFAALCAQLGQPELASDPRFAGALERHRHHDDLDALISAWTADKDRDALFRQLQDAGVPAAPVYTIGQVFRDPHLQERGMWQQVTLPEAGTHWYLRSTVGHMSRTPLWIWEPAPNLGADNEYVYKQVMGYTDEEYQRMIDLGHVGDTYTVVRKAREQAAAGPQS